MKLLHQTLPMDFYFRCVFGEDVGQSCFGDWGGARALLRCKRLSVELHPDFRFKLQLNYLVE